MRQANFNAGPAAMPLPVLEAIRNDLLDYQGSGLSILEMSHRSDTFAGIAHQAEQDLRILLDIPDDYHVLFMQGGAQAQFSLTVQNLDVSGKVVFADTGYWSKKAMTHAGQLTDIVQACTLQTEPLTRIPSLPQWSIPADASFLHITDNETIDGVAYADVPESALPLVCDMSSSILSQPVDISRYHLIYAGAQKNIGPAGLTLVIVHPDMLERSAAAVGVSPVFSYANVAAAGSMLNTPPTFAWYCAGLVFRWLLERGGVARQAERNAAQAEQVYAAIDAHDCYVNRVDPRYRSRMNLPFQLSDDSQTADFLSGAADTGLIGLKGHKSVGGVRASLYNAVTDDAVELLLGYLNHFAAARA